jgi:cell wall assembly regulator SMI1
MEFSLVHQEIARFIDKEGGNGASQLDITHAEAKLDVIIRGHYREFLLTYGWIRLGTIEVFGLGNDTPKHLSLIEITETERHEMYPPLERFLIPVLNDGSGNLFCINTAYGNEAEPPVVFWDHELGTDQSLEPVAASFGEWLLDWLQYA